MTTRDPNERHECPLCRNKSITRHCANRGCRWVACQNTACMAVMDNVSGIGHFLDPQRRIDKTVNAVRRLRIWIRGGVWLERDAA